MFASNFNSFKEEIKNTSKRCREEGNKHYVKKEFREALLKYNESLMAAKVHGEEDALALAFANRSAAYLEVKQYKLCLENIQLAKENKYPRRKILKLLEREKECKKLMESEKPQDLNKDLNNFFKLSYPANPKIPFIVDCVEMREDEKFGRGIYATQDLKAGDIIAIEEPSFEKQETKRKILKCAASLKTPEEGLSTNIIIEMACISIASSFPEKESRILRNFIKRQSIINQYNSIRIASMEDVEGGANLIFGSLLNHSCEENFNSCLVESSIVFIFVHFLTL